MDGKRHEDVRDHRFSRRDGIGERRTATGAFAIGRGVFEIEEDLVRDLLVIDDGDADGMEAAEAGAREQRGGLDVGVGPGVGDLAEKRFLGVEREEGKEESEEEAAHGIC